MIENLDFLKQVLSVPTHSFQEDEMIEFLIGIFGFVVCFLLLIGGVVYITNRWG
jgi:hypothetical protein